MINNFKVINFDKNSLINEIKIFKYSISLNSIYSKNKFNLKQKIFNI